MGKLKVLLISISYVLLGSYREQSAQYVLQLSPHTAWPHPTIDCQV